MADTMRRMGEKAFNYYLRMRTHARYFTVVSNNCWGADLYPALGMRYLTPFVGLFIKPECYLRLLQDFRGILTQRLGFKKTSHHPEVNQLRLTQRLSYPIGSIGDDVEIHFMHYKSEEEALTKWNRRVLRISPDDERLFIKFCDTDSPSTDQLRKFDSLPYVHKVCFVGKPCPDVHCAFPVRKYESAGHVLDLQLLRQYRDVFDIAGWLNGGTGEPGGVHRTLFSGRPG
jgi:uncharacterized protein (DUF1919 family)